MHTRTLKRSIRRSTAAAFLLLSGVAALAQTVTLSANRTTTTLPDGSTVPMWGLSCVTVSGAACATANQGGSGWNPPVITVAAGSSLTIKLSNNLPVPTSLTIIGQLGGGIGTPKKVPSPPHADIPTTWATAGTGPTFTPPAQADRVQSFGEEVAPGEHNHALPIWNQLRPGTYLIESGTHPSIQGPMGLYGVLVVTKAPSTGTAGDAYPVPASPHGLPYDSDAVLLLSEIDPVQNTAVDTAIATPGFSETSVWTLKDSVGSIGVVNGGSGYLSAPTVTLSGGGGSGATATASIDSTTHQVTAIHVTNAGSGYTSAPSVILTGGSGINATASASLSQAQAGCSGGASACYPPAVNYAPRYFLVNGQAFNKTNPGLTAVNVPGADLTGHVLLRMVNAGLRMHVPSVVGLDMSLVAEDGNMLPGKPRVQDEAFLAAGKVMDVLVSPAASNGTYNAASYAVFDRELSLSTNNQRDGGMQSYLLVNGGTPPVAAPAARIAVANPDTYYLIPGNKLSITNPGQGVLANDINVYGGQVLSGPSGGKLTFNADGTFTYVPNAGTTSDSFQYYVNGDNGKTALVTLAACAGSCVGGAPVAMADSYTSNVASSLTIHRPGVLDNDNDPSGHPLTAVFDATCSSGAGLQLNASNIQLNADGSFTISNVPAPGIYKFCYHAVNSQKVASNSTDVEVTFPTPSNIKVAVQDTRTGAAIVDYKWVIEEDTSFHTAPGVTTPPPQATLATSFHKSFMPLVATGCTGPLSCGEGQTVYDSNPNSPTYGQHIQVQAQAALDPGQAVLDPNKYYYISVLPGDAANPAIDPSTTGHTMSGAEIAANLPAGSTITVLAEPNPLPPAQLSVIVFEDNNPVNGDIDGAEEQQGLGGFQVILQDVQGATGDPSGQMTYDMYNMPFTNALNGAIDSATHLNMCPISTTASDGAGGHVGIGVIITCPALESDGRTPSPLAGQALIRNLYPDRYDVTAMPGAARLQAGEQWIQTSTLEGTHWNDAFAKAGEPSYFQEYGPPGFHAFIGFINPAHIAAVNRSQRGGYKITGRVTNLHMSRPSAERLWDSNSHDPLSQTTCYVAANSQNGVGAAVAFAVCDADGNFTLTGLPSGQYQLAVWDQWQDQIFNYKTVSVNGSDVAIGDLPVFSWFENLYASQYLDQNQDGIREDNEPGLPQVPFRIRYRSGQISNTNFTDTDGNAAFAEVFPLFNWYVVESDTTRYKGTGVHTVNDAGGAVDTTGPYAGFLGSTETNSLPADHRVPGSVYCGKADCSDVNLSTNPTGGGPGGSTGRIDQGTVLSEGVQAFISQPQFIDYGKTPYAKGENGGIAGHVVYASTRPFDDPQQLFQNTWEPLVPRVTVNLYRESTAADGTESLTLVDSTQTSSWDDWANGNRPNSSIANMNCPGQDPKDPFFTYTLGAEGQYRCYDSMHNWNQMQPAPYDGRYQFPSATCSQPGATFTTASGKQVTCMTQPNPANTDPSNLTNLQYPAILPTGKYVVEVEVPPGYEIVKEEDKNILIGDAFIAPVTQQFATLGNVFILPDQAAVAEAQNPNNPQNPTTNLGRTDAGGFGPGGLTVMPAPCVGELRTVPDFLSLYPGAQQMAPFAGATRPLCDRRELTLGNQMQAQTDFFIFTPTPISSRFTGMILDDLASEFNAASPDFGEKFAVPFVPVSFRDFNGVEVARTHADQFGMFNGLIYSTWDVNPPNPTGYAPNMMITCMNDPGPIPDPAHPGKTMTDPMYNPMYSNFCYTWPFMPGTESYMDTPVLPVAAYASGYNPPDCAYPDATPAIKEVDGDGPFGPYLKSNGALMLTIKALGDSNVPNNAYAGPSSTTGIASKVNITRHYGFGAQGALSAVTLPNATANGVPVSLNIVSWGDDQIVATIPKDSRGRPTARTGELIITATTADPKTGQPKAIRSVDSVTVTIEDPTVAGYRAPVYIQAPDPLTANDAGLPHPIQDAVDAAQPGDLLMLGPGSYPELVILWKPLRLQGVGAASVTINAAKYPTQKLDQWRPRINCFFGFDGQGNAMAGPTADCPAAQYNGADPLPGQEITGGVALLEPSVLTDAQGPGITVLAKNLGANNCTPGQRGYSQGNFSCSDDNITAFNHHVAHARIDGISITGGDAGGAIYVNGWGHNIEIANNRIHGNSGTFAGGILIGQPYLEGLAGAGPFAFDKDVSIHHNAITQNGTVESNLGQSGAGAGVSLGSGTDNYTVNYNFICGNYSEGDGGGIGHIGLSWNGNISNNQILFNESFIQSNTTSGGGIMIEGETGTGTDLSLGSGNVMVDSNYILGNDAQGGHGGGIRLQDVNGADIQRSPNFPGVWWKVTLQNNVIVDNVAGWSGGGISLENTVNSVIVDNTVASNDSTATAGPLFSTSPTTTTFQPAGISAEPHSATLCSALGSAPAAYRCTGVQGHSFSNPTLISNIVWKNRSFYFTSASPDPNDPTNVVNTLIPNLVQSSTGDCPTGANYWDLGVLGQAQANPAQKLSPTYSVLTSLSGYDPTNRAGDPLLLRPYCNGSRVPPQTAGDLMAPQTPFGIQPIGAEDEGGNWVNLRFGPLSLVDSAVVTTPGTPQLTIGDYHIQSGSSAVNGVPCNTARTVSPSYDYDGNQRPVPVCPSQNSTAPDYDMGAFELQSTGGPIAAVTGGPLDFGSVAVNTTSAAKTLTVQNTGTGDLTGISVSITGQFSRTGGNCGTTLTAGNSCTITVAFQPTALGSVADTLTITDSSNAPVTGSPVSLTGTGIPPIVSASLTPGSWSPTQTRNCPGTTFAQRAACALDPSLSFTLTNTGNATLSNISTVSLTGANTADYTIASLRTTCGTGAGQLTHVTSLAPGSTCVVTVQFKPLTAETAGTKNAQVTVTDAAGSQSAVLSGRAQ